MSLDLRNDNTILYLLRKAAETGAQVVSVNGKTGAVEITPESLNVYTKEEVDARSGVASVNGETGAVTVKKIMNSHTASPRANLTLRDDATNAYLQMDGVTGSDQFTRMDLVFSKTDGHPWFHQIGDNINKTQNIYTSAFPQPSVTGNAGTATKLSPGANINGVKFDGSGNITVADSTKVSKTGDTMTGKLIANGGISVSETTLENRNPLYLLGIAPFAEGGDVQWAKATNVTVGTATSAKSLVLNSSSYGTALPKAGTAGQVFFLKVQ